jgi:hypothetical protein
MIRDNDMTGGSPQSMEHGHQLPMTRRAFLEHSPQSVRDEVMEQKNAADELLSDYAAIYGHDWANDGAGLNAAINFVSRQLHRDGHLIGRYIDEHREDYLRDVHYAHSAGYGRDGRVWGDDNRTGGIGSGSYIPDGEWPDHPDNAGGMVSELRELQRARGWTP